MLHNLKRNIYIVSEVLYGEPLVLATDFVEEIHRSQLGRLITGRWFKQALSVNELLKYILDTVIIIYNNDGAMSEELLDEATTFTLSRIYNHVSTEPLKSDNKYIKNLLFVVYSKLKMELYSTPLKGLDNVGGLRLVTINNNLAYICVSPIYTIEKSKV